MIESSGSRASVRNGCSHHKLLIEREKESIEKHKSVLRKGLERERRQLGGIE